jgi:hypothetical protein
MTNRFSYALCPERFVAATLAAICLSFSGFGQYYNIYPTICDSISSESYHYHVSGVSAFPVPALLYAELLTDEAVPQVLFSGSVNPVNPVVSTLTAFTLDPVSGQFSFDLGNHATRGLFLHLWVVIAGETFNEIYYKQ